jgi:DNA polymerase III subunit delta
MTPERAIADAEKGKLLPVYLIAGEERLLSDQVTSAIRKKVAESGISGLNDDVMDAAGASVEAVLQMARTMPMMARQRFVMVRNIESWDAEKKSKKNETKSQGLDAVVEYQKAADLSTVLVLVAAKLDKRRRLYTVAKKEDWIVNCETPRRSELPGWIRQRAEDQGNKISHSVADLLAELAGPELSQVADAVERVGLYSGVGNEITEDAVSACVVRLRTGTVWELVSAVGRRDAGASLRLLEDVYDPQDRGLKLLGLLAWAARQLIKFDSALKQGMSAADAAKAAGAPPFKAGELTQQVRGLSPEALGQWLERLAATDLALKGGSKRPPRAIVEQMLLDLCRSA